MCLLKLPHSLLAGFHKPMSQDYQVGAISLFRILSWNSHTTISTIIINLPLIQREKNIDNTAPDIPRKQCLSHSVRRVCEMEDVTTVKSAIIPKRQRILWFITNSEKMSFKEAMRFAQGHTINKQWHKDAKTGLCDSKSCAISITPYL